MKDLLKENYLVVFTKPTKGGGAAGKEAETGHPGGPGVRGSRCRCRRGGAPGEGRQGGVRCDRGWRKTRLPPLPGFAWAATLLNLAAAAGLKPAELDVVVCCHGDATRGPWTTRPTRGAWAAAPARGPDEEAAGRGREVPGCGQSLARKGYDPKRVRRGVTVAASAVTAVVNLQARGFAYVPAH